MLSYYYYWQAVRRFKQSEETLRMMAPDVPPMLEAQHEMIEREMEYYRNESNKFTVIWLTFVLVACIIGTLYMKGLIHV